MKMIFAIISQKDEDVTVSALNKAGFFVTKLATVGGFLRRNNTTIIIGTDDDKVDSVVKIIRTYAGKRTENVPYISPTTVETGAHASAIPFVEVPTEVGGMTLFVMDVEHFEKM